MLTLQDAAGYPRTFDGVYLKWFDNGYADEKRGPPVHPRTRNETDGIEVKSLAPG